MNRRVVITGMGIVCPLGNDVETVWDNLLTGKSGVARTTIFDASTFPTTFSAEVKNYDFKKYIKNIEPHKNAGRNSAFSLGAAVQACKQARIDIETDKPTDGIDRRRMGVYLGAGEGSIDNENFFDAMVKSWRSENQSIDWAAWAKTSGSSYRRSRPIEKLSDSMCRKHAGNR